MDIERHYMRDSLARASVVKQWKVFDWERAARRIKEANPRTVEAGSLEDWPNGGAPIWRGGKPVADFEAFPAINAAIPIPVLNIDDGFKKCGWLGHGEKPGLGGDELWPTEDPATIEASADGQAVGKAGAVMSDTGPHTYPELPLEWPEDFCHYCNTSHIAPCQDARESMGRRAIALLTEDYGEEFMKNLLRSHKV